jgi:galactokinase
MTDTAEAEAPGRINLIGEHTDYHEGYVLPTVIPRRTRVRLQRHGGREVRVTSTAYPAAAAFLLGAETAGGGWVDYVQGATSVLAGRGYALHGFDAAIDSDVPLGAGLSSSAALSVAILRGLRALNRLAFDDVELAVLARAVESDFVGAPVGIMDPMACSLCRPGDALWLDTRTLAFEHVPLPDGIAFIVVTSGITHQHASGGYRDRRQESFEAAAALNVRVLRDAAHALPGQLNRLPEPLGRRARHIVSEHRRVLAAVDALRHCDGPALGRLLTESHASLRDDYEVSTPEIDTLVEIAVSHSAVFGARLTGGGFGGAVVIAAEDATAQRIAEAICREYIETTGRAGEIVAILSSRNRADRVRASR